MEGPLSPCGTSSLPRWSLALPSAHRLLLLTNPRSRHHSITPKGKLWQEGAGLGPSPPLQGVWGWAEGAAARRQAAN